MSLKHLPHALTVLALIGAILLFPDSSFAQDRLPPVSMTEMQRRVEQLEESNRIMMDYIQRGQRKSVPAAPTAYDYGQPAGADGMSEDQVRGIVADYLKEEEEKKKGLTEDGYYELSNKSKLQGQNDNGWVLQSEDKAFSFRAGVEAQADVVFMDADNAVQFGPGGVGPVTDGVNIRRGRLDARGTMYENFEYMIQYDFNLAANVNGTVINSPQPTEFWGMFKDLPFFRQIRIGNQKPLWSFENWTSSRYQNFMERSLTWDAFAEDQNNGFLPSIVMLNWTENERMTYQAGVGKNNRSGFFYNSQDGDYLVEGRASWLPWYEDDGRYMLHLGVGSMYADSSNGQVRYRARTLLRNGSNQTQPIMTEARFLADNESRIVPELAMNLGPWYVQAEYYMAWSDNARTLAAPNTNLGTFFGWGYYAQVMYFITGESQPYNRQMGRYERLVPHSNFFWTRSAKGGHCYGPGAWLTGVRYSYVNLNSLGGVNGSATTPTGANPSSAGVYDISYAVNWIMNPNSRMVWDLIYEHRETANTPGSNGDLWGFGMRMQFDY